MAASIDWGAVGGVASVIAAVAALITIAFARQTVVEAKRGREDGRRAHSEAIAEQKVATEAFRLGHREEMAERLRANDADIAIERIAAIRQVSRLLQDLIDVAREEAMDPPAQIAPPLPFRATRLPAMLVSLAVGLAMLEALGGPDLAASTKLVQEAAQMNPMQVVGAGINALHEVDFVVRGDATLRLAVRPEHATADASPQRAP